MTTNQTIEEAVGILQQLGLKEYEARCFVGLTRMPTGTAKRLSEVTEVPRTRVYDAIRVLEAQGLVEIHHGSPQQFRAVSLDEAAETLEDQYEERVEQFERSIESLSQVDSDDTSITQEIWSMTGKSGIENRTRQLISEAEEEVVLVVGDEALLTSGLVDELNEVDDEISVIVGAITEPLAAQIRTEIPDATTFTSGLGWLESVDDSPADITVGRLLLVDRSTILVSTVVPSTRNEHAIFGRGFGNGLVVIARRLMSQGLFLDRDPGKARRNRNSRSAPLVDDRAGPL